MESEKYRQKREMRRLGLQTFFLNVQNNHYDFVSNELIKEHESKLATLKAQNETNVKGNGFMNNMDIYFLEKELMAISEMKVIYAYKHFETNLKFLLKSSYPDIEENKFYKWEVVASFLKMKQIDVKELTGYKELSELRCLNNAIKHGRNIIDNGTRNIAEFQNKVVADYRDILMFYKRVEDSGFHFLKSLSAEIEKDLYEYNDERLEKISEKIVLRMDSKTIIKLIENIDKKRNI